MHDHLVVVQSCSILVTARVVSIAGEYLVGIVLSVFKKIEVVVLWKMAGTFGRGYCETLF